MAFRSKHLTLARRWRRAAPWPPAGVVTALASAVAAGAHGIGPERLVAGPVPYADTHQGVGDDLGVSSRHRRGIRLLGRRLVDGGKAVGVRAGRGRRLVTDGPFIETKEWIAGPA